MSRCRALQFFVTLLAIWRVGAILSAQQAAPTPSFEVASVKANTSGRILTTVDPQPGRLTITNIRLRVLIQNAYQLQSAQIVGEPDWIEDARFDIVAKLADDSPVPPGGYSLMLQSLLAERFKLMVHTEQRDLPIYVLAAANKDGRLGPKLHRSALDCTAFAARKPASTPSNADRPFCAVRVGPGSLTAGAIPLSQFVRTLQPLVQRVVVDRTGLDGNFDIDLSWAPEQPQRGQPSPNSPVSPPIDPSGPSIFTAVQEELGLKLEAARGPVDVLVVDHVDHPTEN